jgi:DNA-binding transcriptional ArsR family regulator
MDRQQRNLTEEAFRLIAARFRVLSEPMRLKILHCLQEREFTVNELVAATGGEQANISKHLGILLVNKIVSRRRKGTYAYYRVADPSIFELCRSVCSTLGNQFANDHAAIRDFSRQ